MPTAYFVLGTGLMLFVGRIVVARFAPPTTWVGRVIRTVSPAGLAFMTLALGGLAVLQDVRTVERHVVAVVSMLMVIPLCVMLVALFGRSFVEAMGTPWLLFLIPLACDFLPNVSGPHNPLRNLSGFDPRSGLSHLAILGLLTGILVVPLSILGCGLHYVSRKVRARQWTWSVVRGLMWGCASAGGGYFALRSKVLADITYHQDYTVLWAILGVSVVVAGLGGLKRRPRAVVPRGIQSEGVVAGAASEGAHGTDATAIGNGELGTHTVSDGARAGRRRMVGGAKVGLALICLYVAFLGSILFGHSMWVAFHHAVGTDTSELVGHALLYGLPVLIGLAGLATGIQKRRPGIGILALLTMPIGFFFALGAEDRRAVNADTVAPPVIRTRPIGVTVLGWALIVSSAIRLALILTRGIFRNYALSMVSTSVMPVTFSGMMDAQWMRSVMNVWPFNVFGMIVFAYASIFVAFVTGVLLLRGVGWARWFYLGWGAFGILTAFHAQYYPRGYVVLGLLLYVSFAIVLLRKNSADFFSRR